MLKRSKGSIFIISAPSGAGKTTLCRKLLATTAGIKESVSYTTRKPREGEANGVDYSFIGEVKFREMIARADFLEWAEVHGNLYGTSRQRLEEILGSGQDVLLDIDTQGARQIRAAFREGVYIFVLPPSMKTLRHRLEKRKSDSEDVIEKRLLRAIDEMRDYAAYDYVIVNDDLEQAFGELEAIVTAERLRTGAIDKTSIEHIFT